MWANVLKKYIEHLSKLADIKLFLVRYLTQFLMVIEIFYLPYILKKTDYVVLEYYKNIVQLSPILLLGLHSGYVAYYYKYKKNYVNEMMVLFFSLMLIFGIIIYQSGYFSIFFLIALFIFLFSNVIEKILIIESHLILASIYKSFFSLSLVSIIYFFYEKVAIPIDSLYSMSILIGGILWFIAIILKTQVIQHLVSKENLLENFLNSFKLIQYGFLISLQTVLLTGYFFFDRWFIMNYYSDNIGAYSISFSFAQILFVGLNTIAYSMQKTLGEKLGVLTQDSLQKFLINNIKFYGFLLIISTIVVYIVIKTKVFYMYGDFLFIFVLIASFYGIFYVFSTYTVVAIYNGKTLKLLLFLVYAFMLNILFSYILEFLNVGIYILLLKSGFILIGSSIFSYFESLKSIKIV